MAFDRPLEADRVDELSLLSSFVRAPIVGPIMWMLGGHMAKTEENKLITETGSTKADHNKTQSPKFSRDDAERSSPVPNGDVSDVSEMDNCSMMEENDDGSTATLASTFRKNRKMSWSDESGQNLVEYCDESSNNTHTSSVSPATTTQGMQPKTSKPMKSSIRKRNVISQNSTAKKCVPYMPPSSSQGNKTNATNVNTNGYISPQYGWYVSTTPPTAEQFSQSSSSSSSSSSKTSPSSRRQESPPLPTILSRSTTHPNPNQTTIGKTACANGQSRCPAPTDTKRLQKPVFIKSVPSPMGWPSVPM